MRWLIAAASLGLALLAGAAHAQSPTAILCARYDTAWARVSVSSDLHAVENTAGSIPSICPVKAEADKRVAELKADEIKTRAAAAPAPEKVATPAPAPAEPAGPPKPPPAPCSAEAIDAVDPDLPANGPDLSAPAKKREDYADRYDRRAAAFSTCHDASDAAATYAIAVRQDPQNFTVIADKAQFDADQGDWPGAIADNTAAIALKDQAPPGVNILSVYAARAQAEDRLKMYAQEIADLKQVVDHFNDELHDTLQPFDTYKEALAKAYYRSSDVDDAEALLLVVDENHMDWEDLAFLGHVRAQGKIWDSAIEVLTKALARMPADPDLKARHAAIEIELAQAYQARGHDVDARGAWDAYNAALADDPDNADAKAGVAALGPMLAKPTFTDPSLDDLVMPTGVGNLDTDNPPPFCSQEAKNDYLDTIKAASNTVNTNMTTLGETIDALLKTRATYDASGLLTYSEKIEDLSLFDAQWKKLDTENTQLRATGDGLLRYFARIRDNDTLVHAGTCKPAS